MDPLLFPSHTSYPKLANLNAAEFGPFKIKASEFESRPCYNKIAGFLIEESEFGLFTLYNSRI